MRAAPTARRLSRAWAKAKPNACLRPRPSRCGRCWHRPSDEPDDTAVAGQGHHDGEVTFRVFQRLLKLKDADVGRIATFVMAETLAAGSAVVDAFGVHAKVETRAHWTPDQTFFDLMRDRDTVHAMLAEVSGKKAADKLVSAKLKDQKRRAGLCRGRQPRLVPRLDGFPGHRGLTDLPPPRHGGAAVLFGALDPPPLWRL